MEILIPILSGLAVRLAYHRWWSWVFAGASLIFATYFFHHFSRFEWRGSFLTACVCVGAGAIIPDLGIALRDYIRRPRTISFLLIVLGIGGLAWLIADRPYLYPGQAEQIGRVIGSIIAIVILALGFWTIVSGPFRGRKK